jgi:hypothetical protein
MQMRFFIEYAKKQNGFMTTEAKLSLNQSWQPTPVGCLGCFLSLLARRGCTLR